MKKDLETPLTTVQTEMIAPNPSEQATTSEEESRKKEMSTLCECIYEFEIVSSFLEKKIPTGPTLQAAPLERKSDVAFWHDW